MFVSTELDTLDTLDTLDAMNRDINILYYGGPASKWEEYFCLRCEFPIETLVYRLSNRESPRKLGFDMWMRHSSLQAAKRSVRKDVRITLMVYHRVIKIKVGNKYIDAKFIMEPSTP